MDDRPAEPEMFRFNGHTWEYFRIWVVNLFLTIVTLGIYSAWAKVRTKRYFYGNTLVHGSAFNYTADPVKILKGRILAVVLLVTYQVCLYFYPAVAGYLLFLFVLLLPLVYVMNMAFRMRYSTWRGISFSFSRDYGAAYRLFSPLILYIAIIAIIPILLGISDEVLLEQSADADEIPEELATYLSIVSLTVLLAIAFFPLWQKFYYRFLGNRISYGSAAFNFSVSGWKFYKMYLIALLIAIIAIIGGSILFLTLFAPGLESPTLDSAEPVATEGTAELGADLLLLITGPTMIFFIMYVVVLSYIRTRLTNIIYSHIRLADISFSSTLRFRKMVFLYLTNTLAILVTLGLAIPWTRIRMARYRASNMFVMAEDMENFVAQRNNDVDASADAISDIFDLDIGL